MADNTKRYIAVDLGVRRGRVVLSTVTSGALKMETLHEFAIPVVRMYGYDCWDIHVAYEEVLKGLSAAGSGNDADRSLLGNLQ